MKPLAGFLEAYSTGNLLLVTGEFSTTAVVECSRCLEPLEREVRFELDEQFPVEGTPSMLNSQDYARVVPEDEPFPLFEGNNLVVENLLRQTLLLNMPLQPVCADGPEGECPPENLRALREHTAEVPVEDAGAPRGPLAELLAMSGVAVEDTLAAHASGEDELGEDASGESRDEEGAGTRRGGDAR